MQDEKLFFAALILFYHTASFSLQLATNKIAGIRQNVNSDIELKFEIFKQGNTYSEKLRWTSTMFEADGKTAKIKKIRTKICVAYQGKK